MLSEKAIGFKILIFSRGIQGAKIVNYKKQNKMNTLKIIFLLTCVISCGVPKNEHDKLKSELEKVTQELNECTNGVSNHDGHHDNHSMETLSLEKRIAFMSGHVEAGLSLYRAGKLDQAAKHLLHPVSETHQAERAGIDSLGFTPEVFKAVSKALDQGRPASEIEPMLIKAEANILLLQKNSGGDTTEIIKFLMEKVAEEYNEGVTDGKIVEAGEYQDAYGFSVVALKIAKRIKSEGSKQLVQESLKLVNMWPEIGPLADSKPLPLEELNKQIENIIKNL